MNYNYSRLLGRMKERGYTQERLSRTLGINVATLSQKLNNRSEFTQHEMDCILRVLDIPAHEIKPYFFAR